MAGVKKVKSVEAFPNESDKKLKFCVNYGNPAMHTAYFKVEGVITMNYLLDSYQFFK